MTQLAFSSAALLEAITPSSSFHELTNDFGAFLLELRGKRVDIDAGFGELGQHLLAIAAVHRHRRADFAMIGEGLQRCLPASC